MNAFNSCQLQIVKSVGDFCHVVVVFVVVVVAVAVTAAKEKNTNPSWLETKSLLFRF